MKNKRQNTRSRVWTDIIAIIEIEDPFSRGGRKHLKFSGNVEDLGSSGMFLKTAEEIPVPANAVVTIDFDPIRPGSLQIKAAGETVRKSPNGVGIRFTEINLQKLQQCILGRINRSV